MKSDDNTFQFFSGNDDKSYELSLVLDVNDGDEENQNFKRRSLFEGSSIQLIGYENEENTKQESLYEYSSDKYSSILPELFITCHLNEKDRRKRKKTLFNKHHCMKTKLHMNKHRKR